MIIRLLLLTIYFFIFSFVNAQSIDTLEKTSIVKAEIKYDTSYIYQFERKFVIRSIVASKNFNLIIAPKNNIENSESLKVKYKPNVSYYSGLGASYNNLYFQMLFSIPNSHKHEEEYGTTQYTDLNLGFHHDKLSEAFFYQKFKGLYAETNHLGYEQNIIREDIELLKTGIRVFYQFNERFSVHSVYKQTQLQKKSTDAWMARIDAYYQRITADSSILLTPEQNEYYSGINNLWKVEHYVINFQFGYAYNFSFAKHFYISPFIFAGMGPQQIQYDDLASKIYSINYSANLKLFAGYTRKRILIGIIFDTQYHITPTDIARIYTNSPFIQFSAGYRFNL